MDFIPEGYEQLSDWLDREARKLFVAEYPVEISEAAITDFIEKHPDQFADRAANALENFTAGNFTAGNVIYDLPYRRAAKDAPIVNELFSALQAETDKALMPSSIARSVLGSERTEKIEALKLRAFERYRQRFYDGIFRTFTLAADGTMKKIPPHVWGGDDAASLIASCAFDDRPILVRLGQAEALDMDAPPKPRRGAPEKEYWQQVEDDLLLWLDRNWSNDKKPNYDQFGGWMEKWFLDRGFERAGVVRKGGKKIPQPSTIERHVKSVWQRYQTSLRQQQEKPTRSPDK